jgi:hypothetical protein
MVSVTCSTCEKFGAKYSSRGTRYDDEANSAENMLCNTQIAVLDRVKAVWFELCYIFVLPLSLLSFLVFFIYLFFCVSASFFIYSCHGRIFLSGTASRPARAASYVTDTVVLSSVKSFEAEARLNNIYEFSPYLKENTTLHHYKDQLVNAV